MKTLLYKEFRLVLHPVTLLFLPLSAMVLIPSYPYYVVFFYTALGLFFSCLSGRENHDIAYTLSLPVQKKDAVGARVLFAVMVEGLQFLMTVLFSLLRRALPLPANAAGIEANLAFFGFSLLLMGLFNFVFFPRYYKAPHQVGRAFAIASVALFLGILILEICVHALPFFRDRLDTPDPEFWAEKLAVLASGALLFFCLTGLAWRRSCSRFEKLDL